MIDALIIGLAHRVPYIVADADVRPRETLCE